LLTLGATVEVASGGGTRRLALSDFITGVRRIDLRPDELVVAIHIPAQPPSARGSFIKLGARRYLVISIAMVSALVVVDADGRIELARIAVGSCSAVAQRLTGLEAALVGGSAAELAQATDIWAENLDPLSPIKDVRASATYRSEAAAELCARAVFAAMEAR
jgi:CO/xanthine dehydrogenase FAD-binding subunit